MQEWAAFWWVLYYRMCSLSQNVFSIIECVLNHRMCALLQNVFSITECVLCLQNVFSSHWCRPEHPLTYAYTYTNSPHVHIHIQTRLICIHLHMHTLMQTRLISVHIYKLALYAYTSAYANGQESNDSISLANWAAGGGSSAASVDSSTSFRHVQGPRITADE